MCLIRHMFASKNYMCNCRLIKMLIDIDNMFTLTTNVENQQLNN